jgi:peptidoglycan/LPS O-acetylase OafA/YrhL
MVMECVVTNYRQTNNFDVLRFMAALAVILAHSYYLKDTSLADPLGQLTGRALELPELGLSVFFTISGYLITNSLIRSQTIHGYVWKRVLRIFPGLFFALIFSVFLIGPLVTEVGLVNYFMNPANYEHLKGISLFVLPNRIPDAFSEFSCRTINGSLWTLPYEFSFYLILLLLYPLKNFRSRVRILISLVVVLLLGIRVYLGGRLAWYDYHTPMLLGLRITSFFNFATYFAVGMVIYEFRNELKLTQRPIALMVLGVLVTAVAIYFKVFGLLKFISIPLVTFGLAYIPGKLNDFGKHGDYSYGLYIYAYPIQQAIMYFYRDKLAVWSFFIIASVTTFVFAFLSWHLVEKKALQLKSRFD